MSAIAGIFHFDGAPLDPNPLEKMTDAMARRGPDGIRSWIQGSVGLGQCIMRTTPESLVETLPLTNEDETLVLVMDGRVDNYDELRRELLQRGMALRDRSDAELVLKAYEAWGEDSPDRIIGELVFFVWDARRRKLFAARDAAGARHFYYHWGNGWFGFASEIRGLLALAKIDPKLNESRLLDYLAPEFARHDEVGTFYQGIHKLPAGHALRAEAHQLKTWRYWNPADLPPSSFATTEEYVEGFLEQLRVAVKCRLRNLGPVGAMLSGGLDSSSIVSLIGKDFRGCLKQPLRTFSRVGHDRGNCPDWLSIEHVLKDEWYVPHIITSDLSLDSCNEFYEAAAHSDEPFFFSFGLTGYLVYGAAHKQDCRVVFDGLAGDLLFYGFDRTMSTIFSRKMYHSLPDAFASARHHQIPFSEAVRIAARQWGAAALPDELRIAGQELRDRYAPLAGRLKLLRPEVARALVVANHARNRADRCLAQNDQAEHSLWFTSGLLSFAHELAGEIALSTGVEPRGPFSDRRMIEFAIRMPLEAKLCAPWYKHTLRAAMAGILPESVRWRRVVGGNPGSKFYHDLAAKIAHRLHEGADLRSGRLQEWINPGVFKKIAEGGLFPGQIEVLKLVFLSRWLEDRNL